jgi:hypothetical protein
MILPSENYRDVIGSGQTTDHFIEVILPPGLIHLAFFKTILVPGSS